MDFARKQLEKYGWREGKGLGKNESGIDIAIKPKLKFDKAGIGHDSSEQFTNNWWENLYDKASSNVNVTTADNGNIQVKVKNPDAVEISTKTYSLKNLKKERGGLEYGSFIKTSKLTEAGVVDFGNSCRDFINVNSVPKLRALTDDELFAACGGRTAHKGARHGLKLNGKLSRIEKQEKMLLKKLKKVSLSDETDNKLSKNSLEKKLKKIGVHKSKNKPESMEQDVVYDLPSVSQGASSSSTAHKSSRKRKERKRVSFSETVTEYQTQDVDSNFAENPIPDLDSSSQSDGSSRPPTPVTMVRAVKIKDKTENADNNANLLVPDQDEGIDCSDFESTKEREASNLQEKIRKENKRMKRKLKKLRRKDVCNQIQAAEHPLGSLKVEGSEDDSLDASDKCSKCIKRKMKQEPEDYEEVEVKKCHYECELNDSEESKRFEKNYNPEFLTKRQLKRQLKKERRLEKRINKVADTLNQICKISDVESE